MELTEVLRPETLHSALCFLDARALGQAAKSCRLMVALTDAAQRRPHLEAKLGPLRTLAQEMIARTPAAPSMAVLFTDDVTAPEAEARRTLEAAVRALPPGCCVVGATSPSLQVQAPDLACTSFDRSGGGGRSGALMLGRFPDATFQSFHLEADAFEAALAADESGSALLEAAALDPRVEWRVFVVLVAGVGGAQAEQMLSRLQRRFPDSAIVGGVSQAAFARCQATGQVKSSESCVAGMAMAGEVPLQALVSRGTFPLGPAFQVTRKAHARAPESEADRYVILEQCRAVGGDGGGDQGGGGGGGDGGDGGNPQMPAMEAVSQAARQIDQALHPQMIYLGLKEVGLKEKVGASSARSRGYELHPLGRGMFQGGGIVVPDPLGTLGAQDSKLEMRFFQLGEAACKEDVRLQLGRARDQLGAEGKQAMGALLFSCGGRGPHPFGGQKMMDATAFSQVFPGSPMAGFYAGGEIGPMALALPAHGSSSSVATQTGGAALQGFTCVFGLFSVPAESKRASSLLPSTLDQTEEGLARYLAHRSSKPAQTPPRARSNATAAVAQGGATAAGASSQVPSEEEVRALSVRELKALIARAGLGAVDCVEKAELVERALEAKGALELKLELAAMSFGAAPGQGDRESN